MHINTKVNQICNFRLPSGQSHVFQKVISAK
uniref:Uncharacterized protein n=1 Tax=Rhizophora mucronata TaxID=61149 RepID=A0A2P2QFS2_RHIMU